MQLVTLQNGDVTLVVSTKGAEMQSLTDKNGKEYLWQGDPAWWAGRAPVLFPYAGGLKNDTMVYEGREYHMGKHGFAKLSEFQLEEKTDDSATFLLDAPQAEYPFPYAFRVRFTLVNKSVKIDYITKNTGDGTMYFSVGAHEAYLCPEGVENYEIVFDKAETLDQCILDGSQLSHDTKRILTDSRVLALEKNMFVPDAMVFKQVNSRGLILKKKNGENVVRVDFEGFDYLLLWQKSGAPYIAVEPWCNPPEYTDCDQNFAHKEGIIALEKGETAVRTHSITIG